MSSTFTAFMGETPSQPPKTTMFVPTTVVECPYTPAGACPGTCTVAHEPSPIRSKVEREDRGSHLPDHPPSTTRRLSTIAMEQKVRGTGSWPRLRTRSHVIVSVWRENVSSLNLAYLRVARLVSLPVSRMTVASLKRRQAGCT